MIVYLVAGLAGAYIGGQQWWKSLAGFHPQQQGKLLPLGQRLVLTMVMTAIAVGLLALAVVQGSDSNPFTSFFFFFLSTLATLWVITAGYFYSHQSLEERYLPMMQTNILLFIFPAIIFLFLGLEAIEPAFTYPLPKGIPFESPLVAFYAIFILSGAFLAYTLTEREFIKLGKKKGFIEDVFIIAFPAGILGARLWYVWGQWQLEFVNQPFWKIFAVWEGGLAIMGGALGGALAGVLYVYFKRKDIPIIKALDLAVPTILVAQAIGRWGNFFNQEVYGAVADVEAWMWLPTFIREQMTINGSFRIPLFFIESMINLSGYFVIRFGIGVGLKRFYKQGDLALMYLVWYGLTRGIMEPLRNPIYNMGNSENWSFIWGWVFFSVGILAIVVNHLVLKPKKS
jgi:prolipoprotein diacylglyceryl transferase